MAEMKTSLNDANVEAFLNTIEDEQKRKDALTILDLMQEVTGSEAKMWGSAIIGFGSSSYKNAAGKDVDWMETAFSPRKQNLTLYLRGGLENYSAIMAKLGTHACGKGCLYIKRLNDVDLTTLRELIAASVEHVREKIA